jgi:hypothetical protein
MPLWHNEGRLETSELLGPQSNYRKEKVDEHTQVAQLVTRLFCKRWTSSYDNCSKLLLFIEKYEECWQAEVSYYIPYVGDK